MERNFQKPRSASGVETRAYDKPHPVVAIVVQARLEGIPLSPEDINAKLAKVHLEPLVREVVHNIMWRIGRVQPEQIVEEAC